jgi:hypothetical protein
MFVDNIPKIEFMLTNWLDCSMKMAWLHVAIRILIPERLLPHLLSSYLKFFNLAVILPTAQLALTWRFQVFLTNSMNLGWSTQWFSNLKIWALGIFVAILITHGTWSRVGFAKGCTKVLG